MHEETSSTRQLTYIPLAHHRQSLPNQPLYSIPQCRIAFSIGNPPPQHTDPPHSHPFVVRHSGTAVISLYFQSLKVMMSHK